MFLLLVWGLKGLKTRNKHMERICGRFTSVLNLSVPTSLVKTNVLGLNNGKFLFPCAGYVHFYPFLGTVGRLSLCAISTILHPP